MEETRVTVRDLRNHGGDVLDRVAAGERMVVTRDGRPIVMLAPLPRPQLGAAALVERWRGVPAVDAAASRSDLDALLDADV